jgi:hypothetical protein
MKSWRLDPILGEKIKLKDSDALSEFSLQVERAALRGSGVIQLACQLWNGQPQLTRHCAPSIKKELDAVCQDILACAPELDPVDLSRVLAKLDVAAPSWSKRSARWRRGSTGRSTSARPLKPWTRSSATMS